MDRRSFVLSIFGGVAAASVGGAAFAKSASGKLDLPASLPTETLDAATKTALDNADADFNQVVIRERVVRGRPMRRRPVIVRRRVIVRRPRRVVRRVIVR